MSTGQIGSIKPASLIDGSLWMLWNVPDGEEEMDHMTRFVLLNSAGAFHYSALAEGRLRRLIMVANMTGCDHLIVLHMMPGTMRDRADF